MRIVNFILVIVFLLFSISDLYSRTLYDTTRIGLVSNSKTNLFVVEVAKSPEQQSKGLMFRKHLDKNSGMLFVFDQEKYLSFWMKNTYLELAIIFIDKEGNIVDIFYPKPLTETPVISSRPCKFALEIRKDVSLELNVKKGDKMIIIR